MISVLILTKNEELNLPMCLENARGLSDDIVVLDSGSSDKTVAIAEAAGCRVFHRAWDTEPAHRKFSLELPFKYPWLYNPDADEIATPEMIAEMQKVAADPATIEVAFRMRRKEMFMGKWLRRGSFYPTWLMRFYRPEKIRFEREINLNYVADGPVGAFEGHLLHYSFNKGLAPWFDKHNMYSTIEAKESLRSLGEGKMPWGQLVSGDSVARRRALKELSFRLPFRPSIKFWYMFVWRRGFLDGRAGLAYCRLLAMYEYMIVLKMSEIRRRNAGLPI